MEEHYEQSDGEHLMQHTFDQQYHLINVSSAELLLYQQEPSTRLYKNDGCFDCPFTWWKVNQFKFPVLAHLAHQLLCIPAILAPSEHVFSNAGFDHSKGLC